MIVGAPPRSAAAKHRAALELARRRTALQVDTLTRAVVDLDDTVGWARLTELGTRSVTVAQESATAATTDLLNATLNAVDLVGDVTSLPGIQPGRLGSGRDVRGMFAVTRDIVTHRVQGGATFAEGLDASANFLTRVSAGEPHRIGRDGQINQGLADDRFNRYRRVAIGATCKFCLMLATRGAVYLTEQSAGRGRKYHLSCDCLIEAVLSQDAIAASKGLSGDWRNAINDPQRLREAGAARQWSSMPDAAVAQAAANGSREAAAELAARQAFDAVNPTGVAADAVDQWKRLPKRVATDPVAVSAARDALEAAERNLNDLLDSPDNGQFAWISPSEIVAKPGGKDFLKAKSRAESEVSATRLALDRIDDSGYAAAKAANPNFETGTRTSTNCVHVVQTVELRRRGFDVTASPLPEPFKVGRSSADALAEWVAPGGGSRKFDTMEWWDVEAHALIDWPEGARGWIVTRWDGGGSHIFNVERTSRGVEFLEGQSGDVLEAANYFQRLSLHTKVDVVRVDDLTPTDAVLKYLDTEPVRA